MSDYKLLSGTDRFEVVDGPLAGRMFTPERIYSEEEIAGLGVADKLKFAAVAEPIKATASAKKSTDSEVQP